MSNIEANKLKIKLQDNFINGQQVQKFSTIAEMFTKDSLNEMGYTKAKIKISDENIDAALAYYLKLNKKYLSNLINKNPELKDIKIEELNQDELNYSLFVNGVGATLNKLKAKDKNLFIVKSVSENAEAHQNGNLSLENNNTAELQQPSNKQNNLEEIGQKTEIKNENNQVVKIDFGAVEEAGENTEAETNNKIDNVKKDGAEKFIKQYRDKFPRFNSSKQISSLFMSASNNNPVIGLQAQINYTFKDKTNLDELAKTPKISGRDLNLALEYFSFNFAVAQRPILTPLNINGFIDGKPENGIKPNTNIQNIFSTNRLLDANLEIKSKPKEDIQITTKIGPNIFFNPLFSSYSVLYPNGLNRCPCTGVCTKDDKEIPYLSGIHSSEIWKQPEYAQLLSFGMAKKTYEINFGYKPKGVNLDQPLLGMIEKSPASIAQLSATYTGYFAKLAYDDANKPNNVTYVSTLIRPDGVSRTWLGTVGKNKHFGYELQLDLASQLGDAKSIGLAMLDAGIHLPIKDKYKTDKGIISFSASVGINNNPDNDFLTNKKTFSASTHIEFNIAKTNDLVLKGLAGVGVANYNNSTLLPPVGTNNYQTNACIGLQANFFKK